MRVLTRARYFPAQFMNLKHGSDVPLVLMNSFKTHAETLRIVKRYVVRGRAAGVNDDVVCGVAVRGRYATHHVQICCFQQSCFPRMDAETLLPVPTCPFSPSTADDW